MELPVILPYLMLIIALVLNVIVYRDERATQLTFDLSLIVTDLAIGLVIIYS